MKKFDKIYVEITNVCNLNCKFCIDSSRKKEFMPIDDFKHVIYKIKDYTNLIFLHLKGEPLLHPKLKEILDVCFDNNILVNITTNTTLLKEKIYIIAMSKAIRQLNLSIHSITQNNLDVKDNMRNIFYNIRKLRKVNNDIIISYRLWNVSNLGENIKNDVILNLIGEEYNIENIIERSRTEKFIKLDNKIFLNQDLEFEWPSLENEILGMYGKCYGLKKQIGILVNGDVVPCCLDQNGDIKLGNIFKDSLEDILSSNKAKKIIKGFNEGRLEEELCKKCGFINTRLNQ